MAAHFFNCESAIIQYLLLKLTQQKNSLSFSNIFENESNCACAHLIHPTNNYCQDERAYFTKIIIKDVVTPSSNSTKSTKAPSLGPQRKSSSKLSPPQHKTSTKPSPNKPSTQSACQPPIG